MTEVLKIVCIA